MPATATSFRPRRQVSITAPEIDQMQPTLELLLLLAIDDMQLLFWAVWYMDGEYSTRIPWAKVRRSLDVSWPCWTLKRRYDGTLLCLAGLVEVRGRSSQLAQITSVKSTGGPQINRT